MEMGENFILCQIIENKYSMEVVVSPLLIISWSHHICAIIWHFIGTRSMRSFM